MNDSKTGAESEDDLPDDERPDIEDDGIIVDLDPNSEANKGFA